MSIALKKSVSERNQQPGVGGLQPVVADLCRYGKCLAVCEDDRSAEDRAGVGNSENPVLIHGNFVKPERVGVVQIEKGLLIDHV